MKTSSLIIVITTRQEDIAKHCCKKPECIFRLHALQDKDAYDLFTRKVFRTKNADLAKEYPELLEPAKMILKKCDGLPLAIETIGGYLAEQPRKTAMEWRKVIDQISVELEMNPKFEPIRTALAVPYNGLPYYLKSCFLYMSIFRQERNVSRIRLVRRWVAEGYSPDSSVAHRYFMELAQRSMISPMGSVFSRWDRINSCQVHDLIYDIIVAESMGENLVFRLEEGCSSNTHGTVRHLVVNSNWVGDERELENTVELSRIRSLTVFGKWRKFYISHKMKFLRVLDLEGTEGLTGHHLEHIGEHLHLRYLSLRGCNGVTYLPGSVGNLGQLETLDIKFTRILDLPRTITKLGKLRLLQAGSAYSVQRRTLQWPLGACPCYKKSTVHLFGVNVPRGIGKLKTLHTLRSVHLAWGNATIKEIKALTGLHKVGVFGIDANNGPEFCSAISNLGSLVSLSVRSEEGDLYDCLYSMPSPPKKLESLKLYGCLKKLPEWIKGLQNLVKLKLDTAELSGNAETMQVLGSLPNLSILRLQVKSFQSEGQPITFQGGSFRSLVALHLYFIEVENESLEFEPSSMPELKVLSLKLLNSKTGFFSGLEFLPSIKEVRLSVMLSVIFLKQTENMNDEEGEKESKHRTDRVTENMAKQLAGNQNRPILKVL
ncbi:disease resistance protein Pik-2-like [Lolium perenne]|uniref:disease resistance protein Pik-2-like n=1 Tax=Lolium perenne TaxID=4522 RepID=UPI0021F61AF9|nr:disease resistance protein Pik-2-like [Lolium perenne]